MDKLSDLAAKLRPYFRTQRWVTPMSSDWPGTAGAPLASTSWDGDSYSTVGTSTLLDLSAVFGVPAGVKEVLLKVDINDSAVLGTTGLYFAVGHSDAYWYSLVVVPIGGDVRANALSPVPCNADGDLYYRIAASGAGTMDVRLAILGYLL